ncbi:MAG: CvpA family protein [Erysipelotrichaceae bacterium]|nr:CvpA family protein [Erysipelotrichaceae bacterium]MBP5279862.1 CvpA family protein [Erysipelotrichaceae bacterium]
MNVPSEYFIFINIFIIALYAVIIFFGYKKGFLYEMISLVYTALALGAAWFVAPVLASVFPIIDLSKFSNGQYQMINNMLNLNSIVNIVIYFLITFLVLKVVYVLIALLLKSMNKIPVIGDFNQVLGAAFGFVNATIIVLSLSMLCSLPIIKNGEEIKEKTILKYITTFSDKALDLVIKEVGNTNIKPDFSDFDVDSYREDFKQWILQHKND